MTRAVIDTNVLVSALLNPSGAPALVLDAAIEGAGLEAVTNEAVLGEYAEVLSRPKFGFPRPLVAGLVAQLRDLSERGVAIPQPEVLPDPGDQKFWDLARGSGAAVVTGNLRHFPNSEFVLTPREAVDALRGR